MKKIRDIFTVEHGFFNTMFTEFNTDYTELFSEFNPNDLDLNFLALCGNRYVAPVISVANENMTTITRLILHTYFNSWKKVKTALFAEYDVLNPIKISITTDKEFQGDRNTSNENTENNYLYPFNAENESDSVNEGKSTSNTSGIVANTEKTTQTVTREGNNHTKPTDLILAEIQTRKVTFLSLVLNDIKEYCTLKIYD